jgi:phage gpG-like protein
MITIQGVDVCQHSLERMGMAAVRAKPAMEKIALFLMETEVKIFEAQGRRGGGSWKRDTPEWAERKVEYGFDSRINIARGTLMKSLTKPGATGQRLHIGYSKVELGSDLPYADVTAQNRPFTNLVPGDLEKMRLIIEEYLMERFYA